MIPLDERLLLDCHFLHGILPGTLNTTRKPTWTLMLIQKHQAIDHTPRKACD